MAIVQQYSADSLLSLLHEDDQALRLYALQNLNKVVHDFWYQIASSIASVEAFYEDEHFSHRELAAVVASKVHSFSSSGMQLLVDFMNPPILPLCTRLALFKASVFQQIISETAKYRGTTGGVQVFYHLGELDDALTYALCAGTLFDINEQSEYVQTLLGTLLTLM